jgi:magnesium-transporting ATPase (P-type)
MASDGNFQDEEPMPPRLFEVNTEFRSEQKDRVFKHNGISTAKYNCLTFLPLNLFHQFSKMANAYFLLLTLMELIPEINSAGGFESMLIPLIMVVGISMTKDLFEDRKRHTADSEENNRTVNFVTRGG